MSHLNLVAGSQTTCQFGNASDSYGYEPNCPVIVVATTPFEFGEEGDLKYLVRKVDDPTYFGVAIVYNRPVCGALYCTNACVGINEERARQTFRYPVAA